MRARTEDLLTLRDGGPIDAALRERLAADPEVTREIARFDRVAEDLRRLPMLEPPPGVWERIAQEVSARQRATRTGLHYRLAAAAAVIVAVAVLGFVAPWRASDRIETAATPADAARDTSPLARIAEPDRGADNVDPRERYARLVAESARLELMLAELDDMPRLMNAGTARTIADLEDYIGFVDEQLNFAEARGVDLRYREALWRERIDVMNALLHVRYAQQAQRITY